MTSYTAYESFLVEPHLKISKVLDGDSIKVSSIFNQSEKEIRLYGIDAPESKVCRKLREEEMKRQLAGEFIMYLGQLATRFVLSIAPPGTKVTLLTERNNFFDFYKRQLAYVILPDGSCLNEILIREGYARAESEYDCEKLSEYQQLNFQAKQEQIGLYSLCNSF